tara:strand:- start:151 stop:1803 length:1653 start_codon:yes stop_codon:yes gene_type:complete
MIVHLEIKNFILIDFLSIDFKKGFSVITGETGSGKSIILGALNLLLGKRVDHKVVGPKKDKCIIEAQFNIKDLNLINFFKANDLDYVQETIIRREIMVNGRSRAFVNDTPVNLETLKNIGSKLIDIHNQNQNNILSNKSFFYNFIDFYSNQSSFVDSYKRKYHNYLDKLNQLELIIEKKKKFNTNLEYNQFLLNELSSLNLKKDEKEELQNYYNTYKNFDKVNKAFKEINNSISGNINIIESLHNIQSNLQSICDFSADLKNINHRFETCLIEIKDVISEIEILSSTISYDPTKLDEIQSRLFKIQGLENKHNVSSYNELIQVEDDLKSKLNDSEVFDKEIDQLNKLINNLESDLLKDADKIYENRLHFSKKLSNEIQTVFSKLSLTNSNLEFSFVKNDKLNEFGIDNLSVMYAGGKNLEKNPLKKVASGGEKSRILLALKSIFSRKNSLPTIIFDEIDSGTSGEIANSIGDLMNKMGETIQVVAITHLPQVAARGMNHFKVIKSENVENNIKTDIYELDNENRIEEIAGMISGKEITDSALKQAEELLK